MIKRFLFFFFALALIFPSLVEAVSPSPNPTAGPVDTFTLFWPIVAGKTADDPIYFLKTFKESVREFLIFSKYRKADYNIRLAEKRLVEAEKLYLSIKDYTNGAKSLEMANAKRGKVLSYVGEVEKTGQNTTDLKNTLSSSLEKQKLVLLYVE